MKMMTSQAMILCPLFPARYTTIVWNSKLTYPSIWFVSLSQYLLFQGPKFKQILRHKFITVSLTKSCDTATSRITKIRGKFVAKIIKFAVISRGRSQFRAHSKKVKKSPRIKSEIKRFGNHVNKTTRLNIDNKIEYSGNYAR